MPNQPAEKTPGQSNTSSGGQKYYKNAPFPQPYQFGTVGQALFNNDSSQLPGPQGGEGPQWGKMKQLLGDAYNPQMYDSMLKNQAYNIEKQLSAQQMGLSQANDAAGLTGSGFVAGDIAGLGAAGMQAYNDASLQALQAKQQGAQQYASGLSNLATTQQAWETGVAASVNDALSSVMATMGLVGAPGEYTINPQLQNAAMEMASSMGVQGYSPAEIQAYLSSWLKEQVAGMASTGTPAFVHQSAYDNQKKTIAAGPQGWS